ncbi:MAG: CoA-binding protein [Candidatus Micrarchaeia archaeon]
MKDKIKNLKYVFEPKSIAIIGASKSPSKLGAVILKNLNEIKFQGKIYPINPKYDSIFDLKCYKSVLDVEHKIDCAVITIPSHFVPDVLEECAKKSIKGVVILSAGFSESGNCDLEEKIKKIANKNKIALVGPNCLGIINPYTKTDFVFFPVHKLERPDLGSISVLTQSGAVGSCIIDKAAQYHIGISKFISYGNASVLDESDYIEYLEKDKNTKQIVLYIEGTKNGKKLFQTIKRVNKKKPIIVLKAGKEKKSSKAALSHTGNIAGNYFAYKAAFLQSKVIEASDLEEVFDFGKAFSQVLPKGKRVGIITNGGGLGILTADAVEQNNLDLVELSKDTISKLKNILPAYSTPANPLDIIADASSSLYEKSIEIFMDDPLIDSIAIVVLFQAPALDERLLDILVNFSNDKRKPIVVIAVGGTYTLQNRTILEGYGVPTYNDPVSAIKALKKLTDYSLHSKCRHCTIYLPKTKK